MDDRRDLVFERIEQVMPEVEQLLLGHTTANRWNLGQILYHLATAVRLSLAARSMPREIASSPNLERTQNVLRRRFFQSGRFPLGVEIPHAMLIPPVDADARVEAESLRVALQRFEASDGPFADHPLLGPLSKPEWATLHRLHCAHHLGYAKVAQPD